MAVQVRPQIKLWGVVLALCLSLAILFGVIQGSHSQPNQPRHRQFEQKYNEIMKKSGLSEAQMQQIKTIREQAKSQAEALKQDLHQQHRALREYMMSPDATEAKAEALNQDISNTESKLTELRLKTWFSMRHVMTTAQLQKFTTYQKQMHEAWEHQHPHPKHEV